ncbi:hypothetical protein M426DRAFT_15999 [Hypoxylon sp. CI-4A]|nr:hypothetical protein M426DRAFT_15999 [Hypoxylon sp. CI-4A]
MQVMTNWTILASVAVSVASSTTSMNQTPTITNDSSIHSSPKPGHGTPMKDFHLQCDSGSLGLVKSKERSGIYYLRAVCGGLYHDSGASRCSYLDLSMCYINDSGNLRAQKMGEFTDTCHDCVFYNAHGSNMMACTCTRGDAYGGGTQETAVQLDDLLFAKNGFLSCYGFTNFECPNDDVPY